MTFKYKVAGFLNHESLIIIFSHLNALHMHFCKGNDTLEFSKYQNLFLHFFSTSYSINEIDQIRDVR